jgi:hypothetical protein
MSDYWVPRVFRIDGTGCVIRLAPAGRTGFDPETASKVTAIVEAAQEDHFKVHAYSRLAGVGTTADRDMINVTFGVQTAWIGLADETSRGQPGSSWATPDHLKKLERVKGVLADNHHFRSVVTVANWIKYYWSVHLQLDKEAGLPTNEADVNVALAFARSNGVPVLLMGSAQDGIVDTTTDAEGRDNAAVVYYLVANLTENLKCTARSPWHPNVDSKLKGDPIPDAPLAPPRKP